MTTKMEPGAAADLSSLATVLLGGPNIDMRVKAAHSLVQLGSESAIELVAKALDDSNPTFRARLLKVIRQSDHPASADILIKALNDPDCYVRKIAVESFSTVDHPDIIRALVACLEDEEINVRESAVIAFEKCRDADMALDVLVGALSDTNWNVRRESAVIIAKVGGWRAAEALKRLLKDGDPEVRLTALSGLAKVLGEEVIDSAIEALADADRSVQLEALHIVGDFGAPSMIPALEQMASGEDCPTMLERAARAAQRRIEERGAD